MFCIGLLPVPPADVVIGNTPLFFSAQGSVVNDSAVREAKSETKAGAGHLNDAPSGRGRLATREVGRVLFSLSADDAGLFARTLPLA